MIRPRQDRNTEARRGVVLLTVLALLTLFALVGISFVLYADAQATSARIYRESQAADRPDADPELLLAYFLGQFLYDTADDHTGVYSSLRGHSLARLVYGYNDDDGATNDRPFSGTGRLHGPFRFPWKAEHDDYELINYTYFQADGFLRDPERLTFVADPDVPGNWWLGSRTDPQQPRGQYAGGFNVPYTYPDVHNLFLAAVKADGTVLVPSFHRPYLFNPDHALDDRANPNWTNKEGKYLLLRPRPEDMGPGFPYPEDAGGDVKNLVGGPGGNDSLWLDLGAPVLTAPDGRKFKPLFAPLVLDLDNRINVNVHGNVRGQDLAHASHQGWGPWEVNLGKVLSKTDASGNLEWPRLFAGSAAANQYGRYGGDGRPTYSGNVAQSGSYPHFYAQVDFDAVNDGWGGPLTGRLGLPGHGGTALSPFPTFAAGHGNGSQTERKDHPLLYDVTKSQTDPYNDDRVFGASNLEALLRYGDKGSPALTSDLFRLCPQSLADARLRRLVTTHSADLAKPGVTAWLYDPAESAYRVPLADAAPQGGRLLFPALNKRLNDPPTGSDFAKDWRAVSAALERLELNRPLPPFPHLGSGNGSPPGPALVGPHDRFDTPAALSQFQDAMQERQQFADRIYRLLLTVTATPAVKTAAAPAPDELATRRWLAQLAVNIVDFIDEDDIHTPFQFYTEQDAYPKGRPDDAPRFDPGTGGPDRPSYWVFGTELPHVVVNEVLAESAGGGVNLWVELHNPFEVPAGASNIQALDRQPVPFNILALPLPSLSNSGHQGPYAPYRLVIAAGAPQGSDNVLGYPDAIQAQTDDSDFVRPVRRIDGAPQPPAIVPLPPPPPAPPPVPPPTITLSPYIDARGGFSDCGFFLLGPPDDDANNTVVAKARQGPVPDATPYLRTPRLRLAGGGNGAVLLRRLANPHIPHDPNPSVTDATTGEIQTNAWYNPYVTIDCLPDVSLGGAGNARGYGKEQPYAAHSNLCTDQTADDAMQLTQHTLGLTNKPLPANGHYDWLVHLDRQLASPPELLQVSAHAPHLLTRYFYRDFSTALTKDIPAPGPAPGPLQVEAITRGLAGDLPWSIQPGMRLRVGSGGGQETVTVLAATATTFTAVFTRAHPAGSLVSGMQPFAHRAPWFDLRNRLYRAFEFLETRSRAAGMADTGRLQGKVNLNTVWDEETLLALCDPQGNNFFTEADVKDIFKRLLGGRDARGKPYGRTPDGKPGLDDRPFLGFAPGPWLGTATGTHDVLAGQGRPVIPKEMAGNWGWRIRTGAVLTIDKGKAPDEEKVTVTSVTRTGFVADFTRDHQRGFTIELDGPDIEDTFVRSYDGGERRLFQPAIPDTTAANDPARHPHVQYEMLTKLFNHATARSNVFAVWLTVGFFEVTDDTARPVKLGREVGRAENRHVRHRLFAIVDRTGIGLNPRPVARFDMRDHAAVLYLSVID